MQRVLTSQLLRVASVFVGAGAGFYETTGALGLLLVPVIGYGAACAALRILNGMGLVPRA